MKKYTPLIFLILSFKFLVGFAQTSKIDSLKNLLQQHTEKDTTRINLLNSFAELVAEKGDGKSINYAEDSTRIEESSRWWNDIN